MGTKGNPQDKDEPNCQEKIKKDIKAKEPIYDIDNLDHPDLY